MHRRPLHAVVAFATALWFASGAAAAGPEERAVIVLPAGSDGATAAELAAALRVHLGGGAAVELGAPLGAQTLGERFAHASSLVTGGGALLVVWVERVAGAGAHDDYVVYAVGRDPSRALVEVVRVPADGRAGAVRIMALKVSSLIDLLRVAAAGPADVEAAFVRASAAPAAGGAAIFAELGGAAVGPGGDVGPRPGALAAAGLELARGSGALSVHLSGRLARVGVADEGRDLEVDEVAITVGLRALRRRGRFAAGLGIDLGAWIFAARGTAGGRTDKALSVIPTVAVAAEGRASLTRRLELRLALGAEVDAIRQRFLLLREPAADLGRWRPMATLSAVWVWR